MRVSAQQLQVQQQVVQSKNLCNTCAKLWSDCGFLSVRTTRRISFHPSSAGYIATVKCPGYVYWSERAAAIV